MSSIKEEVLYSAIESTYPRAFLSKLLDPLNGKFFSTSYKSQFEVKVPSTEAESDEEKIRFKLEGEMTSRSRFLRLMARAIMDRGKLINLDRYFFNPFEVNDISAQVSLVPVFSFSVEDILNEPSLCISNDLLFATAQNMY